MKLTKSKPILLILFFFLLCFSFRLIEYLLFRTDQSFIGEAIIHKLAGIISLAVAVHLLSYSWPEIGFSFTHIRRYVIPAMIFSFFIFAIAYGLEILFLAKSGKAPVLQFFNTSYSILGNRDLQNGIGFILLCIVGNVINVIMEEGVFRGFFVRLAQEKHAFFFASIFSSALFGLWHIVQPLRNVLDGNQSVLGALGYSLMLVGSSTLLGFQFCMLYRLTGSLWAGMVMHFVNNTSANLLHVVTDSGVDELMTLRISVAQTLSFLIVLVIFLFWRNRSYSASS